MGFKFEKINSISIELKNENEALKKENSALKKKASKRKKTSKDDK